MTNTIVTLVKSIAIALAMLHYGHPVHTVTVPKPAHSAAYYRAHPCAAGHPPVSPDWGVCVGTEFRAS